MIATLAFHRIPVWGLFFSYYMHPNCLISLPKSFARFTLFCLLQPCNYMRHLSLMILWLMRSDSMTCRNRCLMTNSNQITEKLNYIIIGLKQQLHGACICVVVIFINVFSPNYLELTRKHSTVCFGMQPYCHCCYYPLNLFLHGKNILLLRCRFNFLLVIPKVQQIFFMVLASWERRNRIFEVLDFKFSIVPYECEVLCIIRQPSCQIRSCQKLQDLN